MQQFTVEGDYVDLRVRASRGLVYVAVYGLANWEDFCAALLRCTHQLNEPAHVLLLDYTSAKICKLPRVGAMGIKRHQFDGSAARAAAFIVPSSAMDEWRAQLKSLRGLARQKAIFSEDHRLEATRWAAARSRIKRVPAAAPSSVLGLLEEESAYRVI